MTLLYLYEIVWKHAPLAVDLPFPPSSIHNLNVGDGVPDFDGQLVRIDGVIVVLHQSLHCTGWE